MKTTETTTCAFCQRPRFTSCSECKAAVCQDCFRPHPIYASDALCFPADERQQYNSCYAQDRRTFLR